MALLSLRFASGREAFAVEQGPWDSVPCRLRMAGVVAPEALLWVLTGADIAAACLAASQHVDMEHNASD